MTSTKTLLATLISSILSSLSPSLRCCATLFCLAQCVHLAAEDQWSLSGPDEGAHGTNTLKLINSGLLQKPKTPLLVAVIDSGFDLEHEDLQGIWKGNDAELNGTAGVDDDKNGYIDDVQGWNFVGGPDGTNVVQGRLEIVREIQRMEKIATEGELNDQQQIYLKQLHSDVIEKRAQHSRGAMQAYFMLTLWKESRRIAKEKGIDPNDLEAVGNMPVANAEEFLAREAMAMIIQNNMEIESINMGLEISCKTMMIHFDKNFSESAIIGDDPEIMDDIGYGNTDLSATMGHGTAVTSLIAATSDNDTGIIGQCPTGYVNILPIRAVPHGDERDKDIANALRYAVDSGAKIVNMSFGKYYSPNKEYVDAAFAYALEKGVLIVIGSGNDATDIAETTSYPNAWPMNHEKYTYPEYFPHVLAVGASGNQPQRSLTAPWSNYSKTRVHIFAPGARVMCAEPDNGYDLSDGTSLSSPVVAGVAALLWSQFPDKSWKDIHDAIMKGARQYPDLQTRIPGTRDTTTLSELCISGGIIDAWRSYHLLKNGTLPTEK